MDFGHAVSGAPAVRWTPRRLLPAGDDRLAQMVGSGHEEAFTTLYNRYHQRLYRYCRSMLGNDDDAQDALQSTFAGAFAALADGRRDAPVRPWLYRIAHNESVSIMRRRRPEVEIAEDHLRPACSAADVADDRARLDRLMADLADLTERQRAALVLRELSGLSHAEIATALTIDQPAAKQTILEARRSLQEFAEGRAMCCDEICGAISAGGGRALRGRRVKAHLRDCRSCRAFAAAIPARTRDLRAIAPPLAGTAAISILRRAIASTSSHGGSGGAGVAAGTAGAAGKALGVVTAGKALVGAAAVVIVAAGTTGAVRSLAHSSRPPAPVVAPGSVGGRPTRSHPSSAIGISGAAGASGASVAARADGHRPTERARVHGAAQSSASAVAHRRYGLSSSRFHGHSRAGGQSAGASLSVHAHRSTVAVRTPTRARGRAGNTNPRPRMASTGARAAIPRRRSGSVSRPGNGAAAHNSHRAHRSRVSPSPAASGVVSPPAALTNGLQRKS